MVVSQELLFVITETRDRVINFLAWIYNLRKMVSKNQDAAVSANPKSILADVKVNKKWLRELCFSMETMKLMFLFKFFNPNGGFDIKDYDLDFYRE